MKLTGKIMLFFSSYFILFLILLFSELSYLPEPVKFSKDYIYTNFTIFILIITYATLIILSIISLIVFIKTYKYSRSGAKRRIHIKLISNSTSEVISYLLTMIIPLISHETISILISNNQWVRLISILIIIIVVLLLYISSNLIVINPMLILIGYSIYKIQYNTEDNELINIEGILLSDSKFEPEEIKPIKKLNSHIEDKFYLEVDKIDTGIFYIKIRRHKNV